MLDLEHNAPSVCVSESVLCLNDQHIYLYFIQIKYAVIVLHCVQILRWDLCNLAYRQTDRQSDKQTAPKAAPKTF